MGKEDSVSSTWWIGDIVIRFSFRLFGRIIVWWRLRDRGEVKEMGRLGYWRMGIRLLYRILVGRVVMVEIRI